MDTISKGGIEIRTGYYGSLGFLDNQGQFDETFEHDPVLLPPKPATGDSATTVKMLLTFGDQCRLNMYLNACRQFHMGNATVDKNTNMMEVYHEIAKLKQEYIDSHGRLIVEMPEALFVKSLTYAGSLPDCAKGWPIQLCLTYYTALINTISSRMMSDGA